MDVHREIRHVLLIGATAAVAIGVLVGHTIDLLIHRHRQSRV